MSILKLIDAMITSKDKAVLKGVIKFLRKSKSLDYTQKEEYTDKILDIINEVR